MKLTILSIFTIFLFIRESNAQNFTTNWDLSKAGSGATQITFSALVSSGGANYTWTEISPGSSSGSGTLAVGAGLKTISSLPTNAIIELQIVPTNLQQFYINNAADRLRITSITDWGTTTWTSMANMFYGCTNLTTCPTAVPVLSSVTDMSSMFRFCSNFTGSSGMNNWNTAAVTNMSYMFYFASGFNQNIGSWNTSAVTDMNNMFNEAIAFNQNIGSWNTSAVANMSYLFYKATIFNQNIGSWNTASVTNMQNMFNVAIAFNQNIGSWNTAAVTNMRNMFGGAAAFNHNIGSWNTASVTNMRYMFYSTSAFNQNIGSWNTSAVTDMSGMFRLAKAFNEKIGNWNTAAVINMSFMFSDANNFNQDIGAWNTSAVTDMSYMFDSASAFNKNIGNWNTAAVYTMSYMFNGATAFNQNIGNWILNSAVFMTNMLINSGMDCGKYGQTLVGWAANGSTPSGRSLGATGKSYAQYATAARTTLTGTKTWTITDAGAATGYCDEFITEWNLSTAGSGSNQIKFNATIAIGGADYYWRETSPGFATGSGTLLAGTSTRTITGLPTNAIIDFYIAPKNLQSFAITSGTDRHRLTKIQNWGSTNWTSMSNMFSGCSNLTTCPVSVPILSSVTDVGFMFGNCSSFIGSTGMNNWNTATVTNMYAIFYNAGAFNQNISSWNTAAVTNMSYMFYSAITFNQNIGSWNTAAVTNLTYMFYNATIFNQNINAWNTSAVTNMNNLFYGASSFNQSLSSWNTIAVTNMSNMFGYAAAFNQNIRSWNTTAVTNMAFMFGNAIVFNQNIDSWNTSAVTNMSSMFYSTYAFNQNINNWNTSSVTNMSYMFYSASTFNQNLGSWNTAAVTNMSYMFGNAIVFNQNIGTWNTAAVTNMVGMFFFSSAFNQNIGAWNTASVTNMNKMFYSATVFNQNLGTWNTTAVTDMSNMFNNATAFNQNIGSWSLNSAVLMNNMLDNCGMDCGKYGQTLVGWAANGSSPSGRSLGATGKSYAPYSSAARTTLTGTKTWTITDAGVATGYCDEFVSEWNLATAGSGANQITFNASIAVGGENYYWVETSPGSATGSGTLTAGSSLRTITGLPTNAKIDFYIAPNNLQSFAINSGADRNRLTKIQNWGTTNWTSMANMFYGCTNLTTCPVSVPILSSVTDMSYMFINCVSFTGSSGMNSWNTDAVTNMSFIFYNAPLFNQNIGTWNTASVTDMSYMFGRASSFNQNIGLWNTALVINMGGMFAYASAFNQNIGSWNTATVTNMSALFFNALTFNQNIGSWNTAAVTNMNDMFVNDSVFNQNIGSWNTAAVNYMGSMFLKATAFNQNIGLWNTAAVINMNAMFKDAKSFNQNIGLWNTASVTNMGSMFYNACTFNQNIGSWNTGAVFDMSNMFNYATAFNQDLGAWLLSSAPDLTKMLDSSGLNCSNYSATLIGWELNNPTITGINLGASNLFYNNTVVSSRNTLVSSRTWTITGDMQIGSTPLLVPTGTIVTPFQNTCEPSFYLNSIDFTKKNIQIDPNGNTITPSSVIINNNNIGSLPSGVTSDSGYYERYDGTNTIRLSNEITSIIAPGSYTTNGGVIVRIYYNNTIVNDMRTIAPVSGTIVDSGWYKSTDNTAVLVVNTIGTGPALMFNAIPITPTNSGVEGGISYVEFKVTSFSSFGYFTQTVLQPLKIDNLTYLNVNTEHCNAKITWSFNETKLKEKVVIQKSYDGFKFKEIHTTYTEVQKNNYEFMDPEINAKRVYYRIEIESENKKNYSEAAVGEISSCLNKLEVYPNPSKERNVTFRLHNGKIVTLNIFDYTGKLVTTIKELSNDAKLNLINFSKGVYLLQAIDKSGNAYFEKLILQ